eukprot:COSAG02_NODE_6308_length_3665_cov_3.449243_3_plen_329_part_00
MAEELSRVERVLSDGLAMLRQQAPSVLRPNVQPRGYDDRQLLALSRQADGAAAIAAAVRRGAERAQTCSVCGGAGRGVAPGTEEAKLRHAIRWLIQRHSSVVGGSERDENDVEETPLLLVPRWRLDLADRALVLDAVPFACPCCVVAMRSDLLFELVDAANATGGTGTPAATALEEVAEGYAAQCRAVGKGHQSRLTLQDAASLAHTLELMAGGLPPLCIRLVLNGEAVQINERNGPDLIAKMLGVGTQKAKKKRQKSAAKQPPSSPQSKPRSSKKEARKSEQVDQGQARTTKKKKSQKKSVQVQQVGRSTRSAPGKLLGTLSSEMAK